MALQLQDPAQAFQEGQVAANTLAALADQQQLNQLSLRRAKQADEDAATARAIFKSSDLSTPEGVHVAASKLTQAGLHEMGMDLLKEAQQRMSGEYDMQTKRLELGVTKLDVIARGFDGVMMRLNALQAAGASPQTLDAEARKMVLEESQRLAQQYPDVATDIANFTKNPGNLTYAGVKAAEEQSNFGQQKLRDALAMRKQGTSERQEAERERHDQAMEANASRKETDKARGTFSEDEGALMAALAERGVALPTGFRSKEQQKALYSGILARNPTKSPDEIADLIAKGQIQFGSEKKATSTAAGIAGRTGVAENEILDMAGPLLQASDAVPRGKFMPVNKLLQMKDSSLSDPNLKKLKVYINSMLNAYDMAAARGGTDKNKREEAHSLLTSAESPEALRAGVEAFKQEAQIAKGAAERAAGLPSSGASRSSPTGRSPTRISSDADYEALPSGATFMAPDGTVRRKP